MTFRARLFLAIFFFSAVPLAYLFGISDIITPGVTLTIFSICAFTLMGTLAGAVKVDRLVRDAETRASNNRAELEAFMTRVHDGIFRLDEQGKIQEINAAMAQFLHYEPDFLKGKRLWDYLHCEGGVPRAALLPQEETRMTCRMDGKTREGEEVHLIADLYLEKRGDNAAGIRGCVRPVQRLLAEEKLKEKVAKELFLSISGKLESYILELNKTAGSGWDPAILRMKLEQATTVMARQLEAQSMKGNLADWSPAPKHEPVDARALLDYVVAKHKPFAEARGVTITSHCFGETCNLSGDFSYLVMLLDSLVDNAVKYSKEGGDVVVTYREAQDKHQFAVTDTGIGMAEEEVSRLFTPFFRGANSTNADTAGAGLGLWMAQRIAQAHHGRIFVQSALGKETVMTFVMPKKGAGGEKPEVQWVD